MKARNSIRVLIVLFILFIFGLLFGSPQPLPVAAAGLQEVSLQVQPDDLEAIRDRVEALGAYQLTADIQQNLVPRPLPEMIGQTNQRIDMRLEGDVVLPDTADFQLRFEGGQLSTQSLQMEQRGQETFLIKNGERVPVSNPAGLVAPTADFMTYLAAAQEIQQLDPDTYPTPEGFVRYAFDIHGPTFANHIYEQTQDQRPAGTPAGITFGPSPALQRMSGRGELWVDAEGLPRRQILDLDLPEVSEQYNAQVHIMVDFRFGAGMAPVNNLLPDQLTVPLTEPLIDNILAADSGIETAVAPPPPTLRTNNNSIQYALSDTLILLIASLFVSALILRHRSRHLYASVAISISLIMVLSPFFQAAGMDHFLTRQASADNSPPSVAEALTVTRPETESESQKLVRPSGLIETPLQNPAIQCGSGSPSADADGDALTDMVETCLGTDPYYFDSDRDMITDTVELAGFTFNGTTWYMDPLLGDSNMDGLSDVEEWIAPIGRATSWDPDNDNIPNPWDDDNDNDGVWDSLDLAPYTLTGFEDSFTFTTQTEEDFAGYQYFELQIRPENSDHLRYTTTPLDWPHDEKGQLTDFDNSTDDLTISPMLAVTTNQVPEDELLELYGVSAFRNEDGTLTMYLPLGPVNDGGQIVAFQSRLAYGPESLGAIEWDDVRFVWLAYMAVDQQQEVSNANGTNSVSIYTEITPIASYDEPFQFTGWNIGKHDNYDYLLLGTPTTPNNDRDDFQVLFGLSSTYMSHQNPDLDELDQRFGNSNTDPILTWGVPAADVAVYRPSPAPVHPDGALFDLNREVPRFLDNNGYPTDGSMTSLLIATEQEAGETGLGEVGASGAGFDINLAAIPMATMRHVRMANFAYGSSGWETLADDDLIDAVIARHSNLADDLAELRTNYPDVTQTHLEKSIGLMYLQWTTGQSRMISADGLVIAEDSTSDFDTFTRLNLGFSELGAYLLAVAGLLQEGGGVIIDDPSGMWSYLNEEDSDEFFSPWWLDWAWTAGRAIWNTDSNAVVWFGMKAVMRVLIGIYLFVWAVQTLAKAAKAGVSVVRALFTGFKLANTLKSFSSWALTLLAVVLYLALFALTMFTASNKYERLYAIAFYTVAIVFTLILALFSFIPGGSIVLALVYLADLIVFIITGESFLEEMYQAIADAIYNFDFVTSLTSARFSSLDVSITNDTAIRAGSIVQFSNSFSGRIDGNDNARSQDVENSYVHGELVGTNASVTDVTVVDQNQAQTTLPDADNRTCSRNDSVLRCNNEAGVSYQFNEAGRNIAVTLDADIKAVTVVKECTFGDCEYPTETLNLPDDLDSGGWRASKLYFDVLPATLDELWVWSEINNVDVDGDSLTDSEEAALGTDNTLWDSDGDGLSDDFEYLNAATYGTDPLDADSDDDGLTDGQEFRWVTLIDTADTDNDGLGDAQEVFHQLADESWTGGGWFVAVPDGNLYWLFSSPLDGDVDQDGLSDVSEKGYQTSPFAFNTAPQLTLAASPLATSPSGATAVYVAPNDVVTVDLILENLGVAAVTDTLSLCLPASLTNLQGGAMQGWQTPSTQTSGNCFSWDFSGSNTLQRWEVVSTTITATAGTTVVTDNIVASLPYALATSGAVTQTVPVKVDNDQPLASITSPANGEIIGGGVTSLVVGGTSSDASSWVDHVEVTLPGQGTITLNQDTSPWAATWNLPPELNGLLTLSVQSFDITGQASTIESIQVLVDNYSPTAVLNLTDGQAIAGSGGYQIEIPLSGSASDDEPAVANESGLVRVQLSIDNSPWSTVWEDATYPLTANWNSTWTLPGGESVQGEHSVKTRAYDRAGNVSQVVEKTIVIDVLRPTDDLSNRTFLSDPPHFQDGATITLDGVANDGGNLPLAPVPADLVGNLHSISDATIWLQPDSFAEVSNNMQVTWLGDYNGDRLADLAVGLPAANDGDGKVVIVLGAAGDWPVPDLGAALAEATTSFTGITGAGVGQYLQSAGDVNSDGFADLLIGDPANERAFLIFGSLAGRGTDLLLDGIASNDWVELTTSTAAAIQDVAGAGDVNGDGFDDILMSVASGEAYLLLGEASPIWSVLDMDSIAATIVDTANSASVASVGDINDDQLADYAVGVGNTVYLFAGQLGLANHDQAPLTMGDALATFASSDGRPTIVPLGDVNGDAIADFIYSNGTAPTVVFGNASNSFSSQSLGSFSPAADGFLAAVGDVDRDGRNDILIGNADGDAYLLAGNDLSTVAATFTGVDSAASAPYAAGADLNSDGASDLLLIPSASAASDVGLESFGSRSAINPDWLPSTASPSAVEVQPRLPLGRSMLLLATTHYVDDDGGCAGQSPCYTTIQAAVNAAATGDTIEVLPGVYASFTVTTDNLTIQSSTLADAIFVDGNGGSFAAKISNADGVTLQDLTLRNAQYGLWLENAGSNGWQTSANKTTAQGLLIYDFTSHAVYMNRDSTLDLGQTTLAGNTNHIGVYGTSSSTAAWDAGTSDSRFATASGGGMLAGSGELFFVNGGGSKRTDVYNPTTNSWSTIANAPYKIDEDSAVTIDENDDIWLARANEYGSGLTGRIRAVEYVANDEIYVGGNFTTAGGQTAEYIAMWNGSSWEALGSADSNRPNQQVRALAYDSINNVLYVGTGVTGNSETDAFLRSWNGSSWSVVGKLKNLVNISNLNPENALVNALVYHSGTIWIGGHFDYVQKGTSGSQIKLNSITKYTISSGAFGKVGNMDSRCDSGIGHQNDGDGVTAIAVDNSYVYIGADDDEYEDWNSNFSSCFPFVTGNITRISKSNNQFVGLPFEDNGTTAAPAGSQIYISSGSPAVDTIALTSGRLVIGGNFTGIRDLNNSGTYNYSANNLVILDVSGATTISIDSRWNMNNRVTSVSARNNRIFAAGDFTTARIWGGTVVNANRIAYIDNSNALSAMDGGLATTNSSPVLDHSNSNTTVFVGGTFTSVDGGDLATNRFARWDGSEFSGQGFFQYDNSADSWSSSTNPTFFFGSGTVLQGDGNGSIYAMRGEGSTDFYRFSTGGNSWSILDNLPSASAVGAAMSVVDGDIYAFLGGVNSDFCRYNALPSDFVGYWNFDEGSGTTAVDLIRGNNGTLLGGASYTTFVADDITFSNPYALSLDGNNDRVEIPNESAFDLNELTVSFWIEVDAFDIDWQAMVTKGDSAWRVARSGSGNKISFATNGLSAFNTTSNASINLGQWYHVLVMYDGSMKYIYINGALDKAVAATGTINTNDYPVMIGENAEQTGRNFDGSIDDVRIYNRALSTDEIAALSNTVPPSASGWDCSLSDLPGSGTTGAGASLAWDGQDDIYATPGSNGRQFYSYSITNDAWTTLGDGSGTTTDDADVPVGVNAGGGMAFRDTSIYLAPGGNVGALYAYGPVGQVQERLVLNDVAIVTPDTNATATWIDTAPSNSFQMAATNLDLVGGASTVWSPDLSGAGITANEVTHNQAAFLDSSRDLYRLTSSSSITSGYHSYRADADVATSGAEFSSIQAAVNSGANQVRVQTGVYQETLSLVSGVTVIGSGGSRSLIELPAASTAPALVNAEGIVGATLRGFTLDGDDTAIGFNAEDGAQDVLLTRNIIHNSTTGIALDGSSTEVEVINLTIANNVNGLVAANCAPVEVRNSVFAYNSSVGLQYEACAPTRLHTYNDYWANGTDLSPLNPGSGEIFLNPLLAEFESYLVADASPIIDAGAPGDPSPPGSGDRVDMGYVEQTGASFYADDDYCATCANDGLTWQVDAFDYIQDALDAAQTELRLLATDQVRFTVGVGAGVYTQSVSIPSYVSLVGSGAENTIINEAVSFSAVVEAGIHNVTISDVGLAISLSRHAHDIAITGNIISANTVGIFSLGDSTAIEVKFNTFANMVHGIVIDGATNWIRAENNIFAFNGTGMSAQNGAQIFSDYNLLFNTTNYDGVMTGMHDIVGQDPLFVNGGYRLQSASPAVDAADPTATTATGGGLQADMGYWELRARPFTVFLGDDNVSTAVAFSGVSQVEYGVVPVADVNSPLTATLPTTWNSVTLDNPNANVSNWNVNYTPAAAGYYRLYTRATDGVNNQETETADWFAGAFFVDDTAPLVTWLAPASGSNTAESLELTAEVTDYVAGQFSVEDIYFLVDGTAVPAQWSATPWNEDGTSARTFRAWLDVSAGSHTVVAVAVDKAGNMGQSAVVSFNATGGPLVDATAPALAITTPASDGTWVTGTVTYAGTASDADSGLAAVEVSFDNGISWLPATISGNNWTLTTDLANGREIEYVSYDVRVRAMDKAGNENNRFRDAIVDNVPPNNLLPVTFSTPPGSHFDAPAMLTTIWNSPVDGSSVADVYLTIDNSPDTFPTSLAVGNSNQTLLGANQAWYVHIAAVDIAGNSIVEHFGPWHVGSSDVLADPLANRTQTIDIDGYIDESLAEWTDDENLDDDERGLNHPRNRIQSLYATWDGVSLYLGWKGAWWQVDGTFWAYVDSGAGGSTTLVGGTTPGVLPFEADLAISITEPDAGLLWTYSDSSWSSSPLQFVQQGNNGHTEMQIPMAVDQVGTLRLVAFADNNDTGGTTLNLADNVRAETVSDNGRLLTNATGAIDPWSVFPTTNELDEPWTSFYEWSGLETVTEINPGQPQAPEVNLTLTSSQPTNVTSGPSDTLAYVLTLTSQEADAVAGLQATIVVSTNLTLQTVSGATCADCSSGTSWLLDVPTIAAGGSHEITVTAQLAASLQNIHSVTADASLLSGTDVVDADSMTHTVDGDTPTVVVTVPPGAAIGSGLQTFVGTADDGLLGGGVALVEVRASGGSWQTAAGTTAWSVPVNVGATNGTWDLEVRATDVHGLMSAVQTVSFNVDGIAPTITPALPAIIGGEFAAIGGLTQDTYPVGAQVAAMSVQIDGAVPSQPATVFAPNPDGTQNWLYSWDLPIEDGVTHTLTFSATDQVGNVGLSGPHNIVVDTVAPTLTTTVLLEDVGLDDMSSSVLGGTVLDGYAVQQVQVAVYAPDGSSATETAVLNGDQWSFTPTHRPVLGDYHLWVTALDAAGNETLSGPHVIYVVGSLTIADAIVDEAAGTAEVTVTASDVSFVDLFVDYETADNEAVAPDDYTVVSGTLTIPAGQITGTISVPIIDDNLDEADEVFNLVLSNPLRATISDGNSDILIVDDDFTPVATGDFYETIMETTLVVSATNGVLANDTDGDGDVLTAVLDTTVSQGDLTLNPDGSFVYTPTVDFWGEDFFTYHADDGTNASIPVTVTIEVKVDLAPFVALSMEGVTLKQGVSVVSGGVGANVASDGPFIENGVEVNISQGVTFQDPEAPLMGDSIFIEAGAQVYDVFYNELFNSGTILGTETTPLELPIVPAFPEVPLVTPGTVDVKVKKNQTVILDAGSYRNLSANTNVTIIFTGGVYDFATWTVGQNASIYFEAPSEVRVAGKLTINHGGYVGPAPSASNLDATDIVFYVLGINGENGLIDDEPQAAMFGNNLILMANVFVPNGTLFIGQETQATGGFLGKWIQIQRDAVLTLESGW